MKNYLSLLLALLLLAPATASASFRLGAGDGAQFPAAASADLGATVYRVVIDPARGLDAYADRIAAHRAVGQEPQLVIGGTGTANHTSTAGVVDTAVLAAKRWPSAYSISVINEPDESGIGVCEYARVFVQAHRALTAIGVRRVLFGEWSPNAAIRWHYATLTRCPNTSPIVRRLATRVAWHGYTTAITYGQTFRALAKATGAATPRLYVTEAGAILRAGGDFPDVSRNALASDLAGLRYWRAALRIAHRDRLDELVAWDVHSPTSGNWDSGLIDGAGRQRPAFHVIARAAIRDAA